MSESGSLTLTDLSPHHVGIYTCALSDEEETSVANTYLSHIIQGEAALGPSATTAVHHGSLRGALHTV